MARAEMITALDDYLIHQAAMPIARPSSSDRNWYDRHWMNGFDGEGRVWFQIGVGLYPNRRVLDAHVSFVVGGIQHCLHASRRAPSDRRDVRIGPIRVDVVEPLRRLRVLAEENEHGIACDLTFTARSIPFVEPDNVVFDDARLLVHSARYSQRGSWSGSITIDGEIHQLDNAFGMRDRSWGVRPVGEPETGAPSAMNQNPGLFLFWSSLLFDEQWFYYTCYEDADGRAVQSTCDLIPLHPPGQIPPAERTMPMSRWHHDVEFVRATRRVSRAKVLCQDHNGSDYEFELQPFGHPFYMRGIGYQHPQWAHGVWQGELAVEREDYRLDEIDPMDFSHLHVAQRCTARWGDKQGFATLETLVLGMCERYGFREFLDGAP